MEKFEDTIIIDEAYNPTDEHPFKGTVDLKKPEALVKKIKSGEQRKSLTSAVLPR